MNLENILYGTDRFVDLEPVITNVKEAISFWGIRYVYIQGEKETFPIDILAKRIIELMKKTKFEFTDDERIAGKKIAAKIDKIYEDNDKRLTQKWFITRFICYIIDQTRGYSPRFYWEDDNKKFNYYTKNQYQLEFNRQPTEKEKFSTAFYQDIGRVVLYAPPQG